LSELSLNKVLNLLHNIWDFNGFIEEIYYLPYKIDSEGNELPAPIRIMEFKTTNVSSTDLESIIIRSQNNSIIIPKYLNLDIMMMKLNEICTN
jgi:hypothetical protein